jgi:uncharacterized membrane protein YbhN (UPF0104 family)
MINFKFYKIAFSLIILASLFWLVDFNSFKLAIASISWQYIVIITLCYMCGQMLSTLKWWLIARASGIQTSFLHTSRAYFIGMFVNCFGLGMIGGDLVRGVLIASKDGKKTQGVATVVADRAQGLAVLALIGIISWLFVNRPTSDSSLFWYVASVGVLIVFGWLLGPAILLKIIPSNSRLYYQALQVSNAFPKDKSTLFLITIISAAFHLWQIYMHWIIGLSLGLNLDLIILLSTIPFVNILSSLPISWNGLGVREAGYIFFLSPVYISESQALAMGTLWIVATTFASIVGGIISLITPEYRKLEIKETA